MPERVEQTRQFWEAVIDGKIRVIVSEVLDEEQDKAPAHVRDFFAALPKSQIERIVSTCESNRLATEYIGANVISENHLNDCKHIAIATIHRADAVVSWNCEDMVNPNRIPKYNEVNEAHGYPKMKIQTPNEFMEARHGKN
jgi:predicted nucleic acid-binding protein